MDDTDYDHRQARSLITRSKDILLAPLRLALSPAFLRTYLRAILVFLTSTTLFAIAIVAYTSFYVAYIPVQGITVPVYLQFDTTSTLSDRGGICSGEGKRLGYPYGLADVKGLVARQKYDVVVEMVAPRSRRNLEQGNWMVAIEMRGPTSATDSATNDLLRWDVEDGYLNGAYGDSAETVTTMEKPVVLARSRRPAILTYRSWTTEHAYRALRLPLYMLGWGEESETVSIPVLESVEFEKGWRNVPASLRLEIRSSTPLEVYKVFVKFVARLEGLRWVMYTHRLSSFLAFTSLFWSVEMGVVLLTWGIFSLIFRSRRTDNGHDGPSKKLSIKTGPETDAATLKSEYNDSGASTPRSDTSRTFPTLSNQQPLHYSSGEGNFKQENFETLAPDDVPIKTEADADDEDEDFFLEEPEPNTAVGAVTDSGIGTSMESGVENKGLVRRKSSRKGSRERWDEMG